MSDENPNGPQQHLKTRLDPITQELDRLGATHVIVGFMPHIKGGSVYISSNGKNNAEDADMLRKLAFGLNDHAERLEKTAPKKKSKLIIPGSA